MRYFLFTLLFVLPFTPAGALDCENAYTTRDMVLCADQNYRAADQQLNDTYKNIRDSLDKTGQDLLKKTQKAWITFRDAECAFNRDLARGGTIAALLEISCLQSITEQRTAALQTRESSIKADDSNIIWFPGQTLSAPFTCQEKMEARIGLQPIYRNDLGKAIINARLQIDYHQLEFPIAQGGQNSLCGASLQLERTDHIDTQNNITPKCPALVLSDGMCDSFYIFWDDTQHRFTWDRN